MEEAVDLEPSFSIAKVDRIFGLNCLMVHRVLNESGFTLIGLLSSYKVPFRLE